MLVKSCIAGVIPKKKKKVSLCECFVKVFEHCSGMAKIPME
jgi:hypothetical protein